MGDGAGFDIPCATGFGTGETAFTAGATILPIFLNNPMIFSFLGYQPGHFHRFSDAFALGASPFECSTTPLIRAQNESLRDPPSG